MKELLSAGKITTMGGSSGTSTYNSEFHYIGDKGPRVGLLTFYYEQIAYCLDRDQAISIVKSI